MKKRAEARLALFHVLFSSVLNRYLTVILRRRAGYELIYITNEAVVNFQAILLISSGETSSNRDIFFTDDAAKNFFPPPKFQHKKFAISFSLFGQT